MLHNQFFVVLIITLTGRYCFLHLIVKEKILSLESFNNLPKVTHISTWQCQDLQLDMWLLKLCFLTNIIYCLSICCYYLLDIFITQNRFTIVYSLYCMILLKSYKRSPEFGSPGLIRGLHRHHEPDFLFFLSFCCSLQTQGQLIVQESC